MYLFQLRFRKDGLTGKIPKEERTIILNSLHQPEYGLYPEGPLGPGPAIYFRRSQVRILSDDGEDPINCKKAMKNVGYECINIVPQHSRWLQ